MSLNSLSDQHIQAHAPRPMRLPAASAAAGSLDQPTSATELSSALDSLITYIPTEVVTLYVSVLSAVIATGEDRRQSLVTAVFWGFVAATPMLLLLLFLGKWVKANPGFPAIRHWPWWKMIAASIAFATWGLAVPGNPYLTGSLATVAGVSAMVMSFVLSALTPVMERLLETATEDPRPAGG